MEYHGRLASVDSYMNIKLTNTEEWKDGKNEGALGEVFIRSLSFHFMFVLAEIDGRCNNVLWISESAGKYEGERMQQD